VVNVIWHKAASPSHWNGSVIFARLRPPLVHPSRYPHRYRFCPLLSRSEYIDRRTCPGTPGMSSAGRFLPSKLPLHVWVSGSQSIRGSFGPPESTYQTAPRSVRPFLCGSRSWQTDRLTDRPRYSLCGNRLRPNNAKYCGSSGAIALRWAVCKLACWLALSHRIVLGAVLHPISLTTRSTPCPEKNVPLYFVSDFGKCWLIFKILSPDLAVNL